MNRNIFLIVCSFTLSALLTPAFRYFALWMNWVDQPDNKRKMHKVPIARIGGAPIMLAYAGALGAFLVLRANFWFYDDSLFTLVWVLLPAAALVLATGLLDDIVGLKPWQKLVGEVLAAGLVYLGGIRVQSVIGHPFGNVLALVITVAWLVGCTNAFNLIDGLDGLATGIGLIASSATLLGALQRGDMGLVLATAPLVGALLGFLLFNFNPASIFLGDGGSLWVGFMLACCGVIWCQKSVTALSITAPMMVMAIPLLDTTLSIGRRFLRGEPIFRADRGHINHRLLDNGFTPKRVTLVLYGASGIGAAFAVLQSTASNQVRIAVISVFCLIVWIGINKLGYQEFGVAFGLFRRKTIRSLVKSHFSLCRYRQLLNAANSPDECWCTLRSVASELGFSEIELKLAGRHFQEQFCTSANGNWTLQVPLSDSEFVRLLCPFEFATIAPLIAPWADLLHFCLSAKAVVFSAETANVNDIPPAEHQGAPFSYLPTPTSEF
jgi:UDP-GlcNAc:undecaprenyl-phosphate GlcNAc-1-phosphate transferase